MRWSFRFGPSITLTMSSVHMVGRVTTRLIVVAAALLELLENTLTPTRLGRPLGRGGIDVLTVVGPRRGRPRSRRSQRVVLVVARARRRRLQDGADHVR